MLRHMNRWHDENLRANWADWIYRCPKCGNTEAFKKKQTPPPVCHRQVMKLIRSPLDD